MKMGSSYQSFTDIGNDESHVMFQEVQEDTKRGPRAWQQYIHDLDFFFTKVYRFHLKRGFACILLDHVLGLLKFVFIVLLTIFFWNIIDYDVLFKRDLQAKKVTLSDCVKPLSAIQMSTVEICLLLFALVFWAIKLIKVIQSYFVNNAIRIFYKEALRIEDCTSYTWQDVQIRLIQAQHLCLIQLGNLNELDIHNRILRHHNYMIAIMNKGLLPIHYRLPLPFSGGQEYHFTYFSKAVELNIQWLLFKGPFALFENSYKVREEYKSIANRQDCSQRLAKYCLILATFNFFLFPVIGLWQLLSIFYTYLERLKRDPALLGSRSWSLYARWYVRHFNELDHELDDRLNRGYKSATKYMNSFTSPALEIVAKHVTFMAGSILAMFICLSIIDEDVITVEYIIPLMVGMGAIIAIARGFISSEIPLKHTQADLYTQILEHIHYVPHGYAPFSSQAQQAMSKLFHYKIVGIFQELISPIATPFILLTSIRPRSLELVDFFRNFTVDVTGTGDVCTFAMMNVKENGNNVWQPREERKGAQPAVRVPDSTRFEGQHVVNLRPANLPISSQVPVVPEKLVTENGKLELSLIHFKLTNPSWKPYNESQQHFFDFVNSNILKETNEGQVAEEMVLQRQEEAAGGSQQSSNTISSSRLTPLSPGDSFIFSNPRLENRPQNENEIEMSLLGRERSRLLTESGLSAGSCSSSRMERDRDQLAMTLSTLFLHEYASTRSVTGLRLRDAQNEGHSEKDPLLPHEKGTPSSRHPPS